MAECCPAHSMLLPTAPPAPSPLPSHPPAPRRTFSAGASLYGVADLRLLAEHTHKFESRWAVDLGL